MINKIKQHKIWCPQHIKINNAAMAENI